MKIVFSILWQCCISCSIHHNSSFIYRSFVLIFICLCKAFIEIRRVAYWDDMESFIILSKFELIENELLMCISLSSYLQRRPMCLDNIDQPKIMPQLKDLMFFQFLLGFKSEDFSYYQNSRTCCQ
jgi:hypothetical protein